MRIEILGEELYDNSIAYHAIPFKKWLLKNHPDVDVVLPEEKKIVSLHSIEIILPLVQLASQLDLFSYLSLVKEYVIFSVRGDLEGDTSRVKLRVIHDPKEDGTIKKTFTFEGDTDALEKLLDKPTLVNKLWK